MPLETEPWVWVPFEVEKRFEGLRVDQFLAQRLATYSRNRVQKILEEGRVVLRGRPSRANRRVKNGDKVLIAYPRRPEEPLTSESALPVLFEDEHLLIINKPENLLSHPTDKIHLHTVTGILRHCRADLPKLHLLHRLDRETSGVLALAKTVQAARRWTRQMEQHEIHKEYLAIVRGIPKPRKGVIDWPIGRQGGDIKVRQWVNVPGAVPAVTRYATWKTFRTGLQVGSGPNIHHVRDWGLTPMSIVRVFPETGRLHQIRVHFAALGHPILGDALYTGTGDLYQKRIHTPITEEETQALGFSRLALHAMALEFPHPITGQRLRVEAPTNLLNC